MTGPPRRTKLLCVLALALAQAGCLTFGSRHEIQGDSYDQVLMSDESQVKVRFAQSRFYDTRDERAMLEAVVATMQDLGFQIAMLDAELGIVTGKRYMERERPSGGGLPSYVLYDEESLVVMNRVYRTWGPFQARADLVRLTVTVRDRNEEQLIVRASAQHYLRPVERADAYQAFFAALEQALFAQRSEAGSDAGSEGIPERAAREPAASMSAAGVSSSAN